MGFSLSLNRLWMQFGTSLLRSSASFSSSSSYSVTTPPSKLDISTDVFLLPSLDFSVGFEKVVAAASAVASAATPAAAAASASSSSAATASSAFPSAFVSASVRISHLRGGCSPRLVAFFLDVVGGFGDFKDRFSALLPPPASATASADLPATDSAGRRTKKQLQASSTRLHRQMLLFRERAFADDESGADSLPFPVLRAVADVTRARFSLGCVDVVIASSARVGARLRVDAIDAEAENGSRLSAALTGLTAVRVMPEDLESVVDVVAADKLKGVVLARITDVNIVVQGRVY